MGSTQPTGQARRRRKGAPVAEASAEGKRAHNVLFLFCLGFIFVLFSHDRKLRFPSKVIRGHPGLNVMSRRLERTTFFSFGGLLIFVTECR